MDEDIGLFPLDDLRTLRFASKTSVSTPSGAARWACLGSFLHKTTLPERYFGVFPPFFSSFLQNEPNLHFSQHLHFKILPYFSVGFVSQKHPFLERPVPTTILPVYPESIRGLPAHVSMFHAHTPILPPCFQTTKRTLGAEPRGDGVRRNTEGGPKGEPSGSERVQRLGAESDGAECSIGCTRRHIERTPDMANAPDSCRLRQRLEAEPRGQR